MAFHVFDDAQQSAGFVVTVIFVPVCIFATALRFFLALLPGKKVMLEDWFALLALIFFLAYASIFLWSKSAETLAREPRMTETLYSMKFLTAFVVLITMNGKSVFKLAALPIHTVIDIYTAGYVMNIQTSLNQTFAKLSLLTLYHRVFNVEDVFRYFVYGVGAAQVAWCIAMVVIRLFLCKPIAATWNPTIKGKCLNSQILLAAGDSVNSFIDFVMIIMALRIILKLHVPRTTKWKLSILFAIGGFSGIIGIIKIVESYGNVGTNIKDATWNVVQQATSIICCCVPIYKPLFKSLDVFQRRVFSFLYSTSGRKASFTEHSSKATSNGKKEEWIPQDTSSERRLNSLGDDWNKKRPSFVLESAALERSMGMTEQNDSRSFGSSKSRHEEV